MTLRVGLIGAGAAVRELHLPGYLNDPRAEVVAIWSRTPDRAAELADTIDGARAYQDLDRLLSEVAAVSICTPPSTHRALAEQAVAAGVHVLLEKPIAHNLADTTMLYDRARQAPTVLEIMRNERYMDLNITAKGLIDDGAIGKLLSLQLLNANTGPEEWTGGASWPRDPAMSGGGALLDLAVHKIDLACWIAGSGVRDGQSQSATSGPPGPIEELGVTTVVLNDGTPVSVVASWSGPEDESVMIAAGTTGLLTAEGSSGRITISDGGRLTTAQRVAPWSSQDRSAQATIAAFVDACLSERRPPVDPWWDDATRAVLQGYGKPEAT